MERIESLAQMLSLAEAFLGLAGALLALALTLVLRLTEMPSLMLVLAEILVPFLALVQQTVPDYCFLPDS